MATSFTFNFNFNFNTLQWRELFSLSYCKCFNSTTLLHTSHFPNHFSTFSYHKHSNFSSFCSVKPHLTVKSPVNRRISAVFCSLNCGFSDGGVEFRNNCGNLKGNVGERVKNGGKSRKFGGRINFESRNDMGCSVFCGNFEIVKENFGKNVVDDGKRRKNGERVNFGRRNEMGDGISSSNEKEKLRKEVAGDEKRRNDGVRVNFGRRNETGSDSCSSSEIVKEEIYGKKDERINFGRGNEMGNGISSSSDKWRKRENNGDSGWSRENGDEILGKIGGNVDFGGRNEMSNGVMLSKSSGGKGMRRMEMILSSVEKVNENRGQKGSRVFPERRKGDKSRSSVVDRKVYGQVIKDGKYNDDRDDTKVKRKERLSKKNKVDSPMFQLKIGLDTCSKIGDVMGAIALYDSAVKQGVKMGQHHYTVLLYLCSSAAMGVIRPAKSGSRSRALDMVASHDQPNDSEEEEEDDYTDYLDDEGLGAEGQMEKFEMDEIRVSDEVKKYALEKGFEVYERMCLNKVPMNEAALTSVARMAMAMGDGDMAFDMVKEMKSMGISPKLRSYGPALSVFSIKGEVDKAFAVEKHMLENGVHPEEPELEALLRVSIECEKADKVYYVLHKLRTVVRSVSPSTAELIEKWFRSRQASRVGKRKWDANSLARIMENVGGGWHGQGWLGSGKWTISRTSIGADGFCKCCGEKLALIDLDPEETAKFAASVASIALKKDRNSSFQKFQRWLDYYGPFEAVVDAANVGLYNQRKFKPSKVNAVVNGIRQLLPSKKWPLIILHNKRVTGSDMAQPVNRALIDRWKNADALYATPTGSNDDWYWLYAAIKFKCLLVTNDEMRDHTFQLLGNDFFPKWKERHQVRFKFSEIGPVFDMPPPCSVVIQESDRGVWHIPIASKRQSEGDRTWLCISRSKVLVTQPDFDVGGDLVEDNPGD